MILDLTDTTAADISQALLRARHAAGASTTGMVLTLVIVTDEATHYDALRAALEAAREHPSRIVVAISRGVRGPTRLDAEIRAGGETGPGETVVLRLHGPLARHADSVVLPLLLPDTPVVVWWPDGAPRVPSDDPVGALAQRRVTDAATTSRPLATLHQRSESYRPGDTDLAWTRLTPWRTLLAAALDQAHGPITGVEVSAERHNPSAELLSLWLGARLGVPVRGHTSRGPGITAVRLSTDDGPISVTRPDGRVAALSRPQEPDRPVALHRRDLAELIAEELRRLDPDEVYGETVVLVQREDDTADTTGSHG